MKMFFLLAIAVAVLLVAVLSIAAVPSGGGEEELEPSVRLFWESDGEGGVWLYADPPFSAWSGGGAVALAMTLEIRDSGGSKPPSGAVSWEITPGEGAEGMTLTVGSLSEGALSEGGDTCKLLLDGYPPSVSGPILRLQSSLPWGGEDSGCAWEVKCPEADGLYWMDGEGEIKKIPLSVEDYTRPEGEDMMGEETDSENRPDGDTEAETVAEPPQETEVGCDSEDLGEASPLPPWDFFGCQETPVTHGVFGVRFLFVGATPVLCVEGGGYLQGEISSVTLDGRLFSACTFRGLRGEGEYTFLIYTPEGSVRVRYEGGEFLGFETAVYGQGSLLVGEK